MSYTSLLYHIVFSTKERRPWLKGERLTECCRYMGGIARQLKSTLLDANGAADHLHLVAALHSTIAPAEFLREIKQGSSKWIHESFGEMADFWWQDGYSAFTVSKSALPDVLTYVRNQQEHHRRMSFQEELIALLTRHGVSYDPKYVLG
jgi:REP element-mobilizing transposase RayT